MDINCRLPISAGSQNHDGVLVVRATALSDDSTPARISRMAADAQVWLSAEHDTDCSTFTDVH